jgi:hypothetical protein
MPMPPKPKERYERPELLVIELKAEEVLAVGCKNVGKNNVGTADNVCGFAQGCNRRGS